MIEEQPGINRGPCDLTVASARPTRHLQVGLVGMPDPERWGRGPAPRIGCRLCVFDSCVKNAQLSE
jgi:hypothetical protein